MKLFPGKQQDPAKRSKRRRIWAFLLGIILLAVAVTALALYMRPPLTPKQKQLQAINRLVLKQKAQMVALNVQELDFSFMSHWLGELFSAYRDPYASLEEIEDLTIDDDAKLHLATGLPSLKSLSLYLVSDSTTSFSVLRTLPVLERLTIYSWRTHPEDLSGIGELSTLRKLFLLANPPLDLRPVGKLTDLRELWISDHCTTSLSSLPKLRSVRRLILSFSKLVDLSSVGELAGLENLTLMQCSSLSSLEPLAKLKNVQKMYLVGCPSLSDLSVVRSWPELQDLHINDCPGLKYLSALQGLKKLNKVYLNHVGITDFTPLSTLPALRTLQVNNTSSTLATSLREELERRGVKVRAE